jgi:hypothetical protein
VKGKGPLNAFAQLIVVAGLMLLAVVILRSMGIGRSDGPPPARVSLDQFPLGSMTMLDRPIRIPFGTRFLIVRFVDDTLRVFALPVKNGRIGMPEGSWQRSEVWCQHFGLESGQGPLSPSNVVACLDPELPAQSRARWRWDLAGNNLSHLAPSLQERSFTVENGEVVIG